MKWWQHIRILPLLVLVAILSFAVRVGETMMNFRSVSAEAIAQVMPKENLAQAEEKAAAAKKQPEDQTPDEQAKPQQAKADAAATGKPQVSLPEVWADPDQDSMEYSPERMQILEQLSSRRQELDAREKKLAAREALMTAAEKQVDTKVGELTKLKSEIEQLLGTQKKEEDARINSLVKIYESMKAKDAAAIFNTLDMDILLQVVSRMKEAKSSPIIAAMATERAKDLTVRLAEQKKLPSMPGDTAQAGAGAGQPDLNLPTAQ